MEVLLFTVDSHRYGAWKDQVSSVEAVGAVHRLPFLRSNLTVLAVMGDHTSTLADIGPCLGHGAGKGSGGATALIMSDQGQLRGFLVGGTPSVQEIDPDSVISLPGFLRISFVEGFLSLAGDLVPVVSVRSLFDQILEDGNIPGAQSKAISEMPASQTGHGTALKLVSAGPSILALRADGLQEVPGRHRITRFPLLPGDLDGVAAVGRQMLPVIDLARRVSRSELADPPLMIKAKLGDADFGFLVDSAQGEWGASDTMIKELPFIGRTGWSQSAAVHGGRVAAVIDLSALLSEPETSQESFSEQYEPRSTFPDAFGKEDVEVAALRVLGRRLAVPKAEVSKTIPCVPIHAVPFAPGMMAGVGLLEGELLPVLDLARILGQSSQPASEWRMILLQNGTFKALVLSEREPETRTLKREIQREVPVHLPYPVVYGCYTEGDSIRLILNIHALALHFDESRATELLPSLSPVEFTQEVEPEPESEPQPVPESEPEHELEHEPTGAEEPPEPALPETLSLDTVTLEASQTETTLQEPAPVEAAVPELENPETPALQTPWVEAVIEEAVIEEPAPTLRPSETTPPLPTAAAEAAEMISADETFEVVELPTFAAEKKASPAAPARAPTVAPKQPEPPEIPEFVGDDEIEITLPEATSAEVRSATPTLSAAEPAPEKPQESAAELEEERFVEEVHERDQVVTEQPPHRARRMLVAFAASTILIAGVVVGIYLLGPGRARITGRMVPQTTTLQAAPQPAPATPAPTPAPAPSSQPSATRSQYVVKRGDTLWDIAQRFTGDPFNYRNLAGRNLIHDPDLIFPGQIIQVEGAGDK